MRPSSGTLHCERSMVQIYSHVGLNVISANTARKQVRPVHPSAIQRRMAAS